MRSGLGTCQVQHTPTIPLHSLHTPLHTPLQRRQKLHKPRCFDFSSGFDVLLFDFSPAQFFDRTY